MSIEQSEQMEIVLLEVYEISIEINENRVRLFGQRNL